MPGNAPPVDPQAMHPHKVVRDHVVRLTDLPNIEPAMGGAPPRPWWEYTAAPKRMLAATEPASPAYDTHNRRTHP